MRKVLLLLLGIFFILNSVSLAQEKIELNLFYSPTCPHCASEKIFLKELEKKYPQIEVKKFNIFENQASEILEEFYQKYKVPQEFQGLVPITFIGDRYFLGFSKRIGKDIEDYIKELIQKNALEDAQKQNQNQSQNQKPTSSAPTSTFQTSTSVNLPFLGKIDLLKLSPLLLSIVLGTLDGFNACAMTALGFLLAVLVSTGIRKRVFLIGGTFIFVSGIVYFLFISAWLNLFLCLTHLKFITILVGVIILIFAFFILRDYYKGILCRICEVSLKKENLFAKFERKLFQKMEKISKKETSLLFTLIGVSTVAAGVNIIELCCSLGFPLAFTKILSSLSLSTFSYYFYLLVYIIFYMLDDFLIFLFAVFTLKITQFSQKYLRFIKLLSGILLLLLGLLIIFYPQALMFK